MYRTADQTSNMTSKNDHGTTEGQLQDIRNRLKPPQQKNNQELMVYDSRKERQIEDLNRNIKEQKKIIEELKKDNDRLEDELKKESAEKNRLSLQLDKSMTNLKESAGTEVNPILEEEIRRLKEEIKTLKIDTSGQKSENDRLRLSLSKIAGEKMLDGNPSITDLSDSNRPQKLAEKYNALYDNSWTDAYEIIARTTEDERSVCETLLQILKKCWEKCVLISEEQLQALKVSFACHPPSSKKDKQEILSLFHSKQSKLIQDTRRSCVQQFLPNLYQYYWDQSKENEVDSLVKPYVEACLELCWYSAITDPPLDYLFTVENTDDFRGYTNSGNVIDYVVWPAMYLYKDGPLLYKGVVQYKRPEANEQ